MRPRGQSRKRGGGRTAAPRAKSPSGLIGSWVIESDIEEILEGSRRLLEGLSANQSPAEDAAAFVGKLRGEANKVLSRGRKYTESDAARWFDAWGDGALRWPPEPEVLAAGAMALHCGSLEEALFKGDLRAAVICSFILGVLAVRAGIGDFEPLLEHAARGRKVIGGARGSGEARREQIRAKIVPRNKKWRSLARQKWQDEPGRSARAMAKEIRYETGSAETGETIRKAIQDLNLRARKKTG